MTTKLQAGLINTQALVAKIVTSETSVTKDLIVSTISPLNSEVEFKGDVEIEGTLQTEKLVTDELKANIATFSTVMADRIISREGDFGQLLTDRVASLRDELRDQIAQIASNSGNQTTEPPIAQVAPSWIAEISTNSAQFNGNLKLTDSMVIAGKLAVEGQTQLSEALISQKLQIDQIQIGQNYIKTLNSTLAIQPEASGQVTINGEVLAINSDGSVFVNGSLSVTGTIASSGILTQYLEANDASISGKLNIATDSATLIIADSATASAASTSATIASNASAGTATLPSGKTELIIQSDKLSSGSLVYLTPEGSTQNQVVYVKSKSTITPTPEQATSSATQKPEFTIAIDTPLTTDLKVNWWIIN